MALYAVVDPSGNVQFSVEGSVADAVGEAYAAGADEVFLDQTFEPIGPTPNPALDPERAWANVGNLYIDLRRAMDLSPEEAATALAQYFPIRRTGKIASVWTHPDTAALNLIRPNYKTSRRETHVPALSEAPRSPDSAPAWALAERWGLEDLRVDVKGLSLVPKTYWWRLEGERIFDGKIDLCSGASRECFSSCLVYSGHNWVDRYNVLIKIATTTALFLQPQAFGRLLYQGCAWHLEGYAPSFVYSRYRSLEPTLRGPGGFVPMVRLNVYSDVPWELVFPDLFRAIPDLQFYDYTKVPGRDPIREGVDNYDLTFSFSGRNMGDVEDELAAGRRVAAVFFNEEKRFKHLDRWPLPTRWAGVPVVDGTISDARPFDPAGSCVGLRWIEPKGSVLVDPTGQAVVEEERLGIPEFVEVGRLRVPARRMDVSRFVVDVNERRINREAPARLYVVPAMDVGGHLTTAVVPRDQPGVVAHVDASLIPEDSMLPDPTELPVEISERMVAANPGLAARTLKDVR